ncbi:PRC-barrel domain-containing protein [Formosa sp. PL04]|uniref:PRC-barrel domain-containing protein n=1 Tax=Formosa sp. PL04 TaxID=3081755 RepID=UPI002981DC58|nr:PRC-barrel domain-containing protein [Formosa sp. PL04]MDW5290315.1 PRC-barrel domain-containing protein [Formosa sp. PL04]
MKTNEKHLYDLSELSDYKISEGYADIRGWEVKDIDNRVIGKVDNLLANKETQRVVYIDVEVDQSIIDSSHDPYNTNGHTEVREFINKDGDNHIIIPIGLLDINSDLKQVSTQTVNHRTFSETKRFRKGDIVNREYEVQVLNSYTRNMAQNRLDDTMEQERRDAFQVNDIPHEERIREIVREEIRKFHNTNDNYVAERDTVTFDSESEPHRENPYKDENFYNRHEFENDPFENRDSRR